MKVLIVQPAFLGDAILATSVAETLHASGVCAHPHMLVRASNAELFTNHPFIDHVIAWDKQNGSIRPLIAHIRDQHYTHVVNLQRHARSGWITIRSGASQTIGFKQNPLSIFFTRRHVHKMDGVHEVERNHELIAHLVPGKPSPPRLYPHQTDYDYIAPYQHQPYVCIAPTSVWFTKQYPASQWIDLIRELGMPVYLLGGPADVEACEYIARESRATAVVSLAGRLSVLQSAALISGARMTFVNDSATLHMASAMNAPVTAIFCSTIPAFGFGPLSDQSSIVETPEPLACRPCGIHGRTSCPQGHFRCATTITARQIIEASKIGAK